MTSKIPHSVICSELFQLLVPLVPNFRYSAPQDPSGLSQPFPSQAQRQMASVVEPVSVVEQVLMKVSGNTSLKIFVSAPVKVVV